MAGCEICGAQGVPVSLTARPDWTPVVSCDDIEACWERRLEQFVSSLGAVFPEPLASNDCSRYPAARDAEAVRKCNACTFPASCSEFGRCTLEVPEPAKETGR